ncbi:MAG: DUF4349 domain-containing protein [Lachnospiraceae bacterium]|nr:DUF4349 domain-containing protein [Lachnospiraceae bacterium]
MKKRRAMVIFLTAGMLAAALTACGGTSKYNGADTAAPMAYEAALNDVAYEYDGGNYMLSTGMTTEEAGYEYEIDDIGEGAVEVPQDALAGRKLIKNVNLNVETEQFDVLVPSLESRVTALGGYIEDMSSYSRGNNYSSDYVGTKYLRHADMTVRMPKENLDTFLDEVGEQTNVVSRSENVTDVTLQYVDLESHKKALTTEQNRLLELMEKAETVEDIITIEGRLSEVRYQIESMESQLRTYDNKIDYSTVYLFIDEVERYTPTEEITMGERIRTGFMDSVKGVGRGISNFAIWFVINLPYLIVWAVIIVIIVLIVSAVIKGMKKRRAKKAAKRVDSYLTQNPDQTQNPYPQGVSPERQPDEANKGITTVEEDSEQPEK